MAKITVTTSARNSPRNGNRAVFDMGGTYYVFLYTTIYLYAYKKTNSSFTEYSDEVPDNIYIWDIAPVKISSTVIRVFYWHTATAGIMKVSYLDYNTSTDTWDGSETDVQTGLDPDTVNRHITAYVDKSGVCHVIYVECDAYHGTDYDQIWYTENSSGWSSPIRVNTTENQNYDNPTCCVDNDGTNGRLCVVWGLDDTGDVFHRSRSSAGSWDTVNVVVSSSSYSPCIIIASSNVKKVALRDSINNLDIRSGTSGANPTWSFDGSNLDANIDFPSITNESFGDVLRVIYQETSVDDILLIEKDGTWGSPETLQSHASDVYERANAEYPHGSDEIGYIFYDLTNTDWYFDIYVLGVAPFQLSVTDGIKMGDSRLAGMTAGVSITDGIKGGDSTTELGQFSTSVLDGLKGGDLPSILSILSLSDGGKFGDSRLAEMLASLSVSDGTNLGDTISEMIFASLSLTDGFKLGDSTLTAISYYLSITDGAEFGDTTVSDFVANLAISDGVDLGDLAEIIAAMDVEIADGVKLGDTPLIELAGVIYYLSVTDGAKFGDSTLTSILADLGLTDGVKFGDSFNLYSMLQLADGTKLGDTTISELLANVELSDGSKFGDTAIGEILADIQVTDGVKLGDTTVIQLAEVIFYLSVLDGVKLGDSTLSSMLANLQVSDGVKIGDYIGILGRLLKLYVITSQYRTLNTLLAQYRKTSIISSHHRKVQTMESQYRNLNIFTTIYRKIRSLTSGGG